MSVRRPDRWASPDARGQATVEIAMLLPVLVTTLLLVVQVGLLARDRVLTVHAARTAARAAAVDPDPASVRGSLRDVGQGRFRVEIGGDTAPGGVARVRVSTRPTSIPVVGRLVGGIELSEALAVRVEGP